MAIGTPVQLGTNSGSTASLVITTGAAAVVGDDIVVQVGIGSTALTPTGVTDSAGNTYTAGTLITGAGVGRIRPFYCQNSLGLASGGTITITVNASTMTHATAVSVSGVATTSAKDAEAAGTSATGTAPSIATGTLAQANEIVFGFIYIATGKADTFTQASGFTANNANTASASILRSGYQIVAATTPVTYAPTLGTSRGYVANVISFKGAAGGTTYNDTYTETAASDFTIANAQTMPNALSETLAAADALAAGLVIGAPIAETIAASDGLVAAISFALTINESLASDFTLSSAQTLPNTLAESVASGDAYAAAALYISTLAESLSALDSTAAGLIMSASYGENLSAGAAYLASATYPNALAEALALGSSYASGLAFFSTITEGLLCDFVLALDLQKSVQYSAGRGYSQIRTEGSPTRLGNAAPTRQGSIARRSN